MSQAGDAVKKIGDVVGGSDNNDVFSQVLNVATQYASLGTLSYSKKNGIGEGVVTHAADETLGAVTGRNVMRESLYRSEVAADNAQVEQDQLIKDQQTFKQNQDIAASNTAGAIRNTASIQSARSRLPYSYSPNNYMKDFLGL